MSHRGSLLCLPSGIWASPLARAEDIDEETLSSVFAERDAIGYFLIGGGKATWIVPPAMRARFRANGMNVEAMSTGSAISTYNILLGEGRPVGALLIAVE